MIGKQTEILNATTSQEGSKHIPIFYVWLLPSRRAPESLWFEHSDVFTSSADF